MVTLSSYVPKDDSPAELKKHANKIVEALELDMSRDQRALLVSEIRNALAPVAALSSIELHEITKEDIACADAALRRILALTDAIKGK